MQTAVASHDEHRKIVQEWGAKEAPGQEAELRCVVLGVVDPTHSEPKHPYSSVSQTWRRSCSGKTEAMNEIEKRFGLKIELAGVETQAGAGEPRRAVGGASRSSSVTATGPALQGSRSRRQRPH